MRTTWENWDLADMQDDADAEGYAGLSAAGAPEMERVATLPYFGSFVEYGLHVKFCSVCQDSIVGCPAGDVLSRITRLATTSQARAAASN